MRGANTHRLTHSLTRRWCCALPGASPTTPNASPYARRDRALPRGGALALLLLAVPALAAVESGLSLRENLLYTTDPPLTGPGLPRKAYWISATFVRPTLAATYEDWSFESALELATIANSADIKGLGAAQAGGSAFARGSVLESWDLTLNPVSDPDKSVRLRVERLKLSRNLGLVDVDVGRQPVTLGTSHFVSVLDVLAPFPPGDLDSTYKPGIDAARLRGSIGEEGEAEIIAAAADPWRDSAAIARLRHPFKSVDFELLGGRFRKHHFGGLAWEGDIDPFAVWGETAVFEHSGATQFSGIAGGEYKVAQNTTVGAAYFYQGFGAARSGDLAAAALQAPYREGWAFLGARQYAMVTGHAEPHALISLDLGGIFSLVDGSTLWQPRLTWNAADEMDVSLYGWLATGRAPGPLSINSEFGSMADGVGAYCRVFF